jgi:hypothetical protein
MAAKVDERLDGQRILGEERRDDLITLVEKMQFRGDDGDRDRLKADADDAVAHKANKKAWDEATPLSFQVLKSGPTGIATFWAKQTKKYGGGTAVATAVAAAVAAVLDVFTGANVPDSIIIALIGAVAVLLSTACIAIAWIVHADLSCRCAATVARSAGRATLGAAYLEALNEAGDESDDVARRPGLPATSTPEETQFVLAVAGRRPVMVTTARVSNEPVISLESNNGKATFRTERDQFTYDEVVRWSTSKKP